MAMSISGNVFEHTVQLNQEVIKYLKSIRKVIDDISRKHGVTARFVDDKGTSTLVFFGNHNHIGSAVQAVNQKVATLSIGAFSLPSDVLQSIKSIKYAKVIAQLREIKVWAGWHVDSGAGRVQICSDTESHVNKAYHVIYDLAGSERVPSASLNSPSFSQPQDKVVHEQLQYDTEILRYLRAKGVTWSLQMSHNVEVTINPDDEALVIKGGLLNVVGAEDEVKRTVESLCPTSVKLSKDQEQRLTSIKPYDIVAEFKKLKLKVGWDVFDGQLHICSDSNSSTVTALNTVLTLITNDTRSPLPTSPLAHETPGGGFQDRLELEMEQVRYLKTTKLVNDFKQNFMVEMNISLSSCSVVFTGQKRHVFRAIEELNTITESHSVQSFHKSMIFCQYLKNVQNKDVIAALRSSQVTAGWDLREGKLWVCSDTKPNVMKAESAISGIVVESSYPDGDTPLSPTQKKAIATDSNWDVLLSTMKSRIPDLELQFDEGTSNIQFALPSNGNKLSVLHDLEKFFASTMHTQSVHLPSLLVESLCLRNEDVIQQLCQLKGSEQLSIAYKNQSAKLSSASQMSVNHASRQLPKLLKQITAKDINVEKLALAAWLLSSNGERHLNQITSMHRTVSKVSSSKSTKSKYYQQHLQVPPRPSNIDKISLVTGYISHLLHQVDGVLFNTGSLSQSIQKSIGNARLVNGFQKFGLTTGQKVYGYHVDVHHWRGASSLADLKTNINAALFHFQTQGLRSILLPAVGTGNLGYPAANVADMMLTSVVEYLDSNPQTSIQQVTFVTYQRDSAYQAFDDKLVLLQACLSKGEPVLPSIPTDARPKVTVQFTGLTQPAVDDSVAALQSEMDTLLIVESWTNSPHRPAIPKLSKKQVAGIEQDGLHNNVDVTINLTIKDITIEGFKDDVQVLRERINHLLHKLTEQNIPSHWTEGGQLEVRLDPRRDLEEYTAVYRLFSQQGVKISEIIRIQNAELYTQYQAQKSRVQKELAGTSLPVERSLWHGTDSDSVRKICQQEFNRSFCGKNGVAYGEGVYFSTTSQYSMGYCKNMGDKSIILAKVVTGRYKLGNSSTTRKNLAEGYHSTSNSESSPSIFVVYHDAAAYPEYVIRFSQNMSSGFHSKVFDYLF